MVLLVMAGSTWPCLSDAWHPALVPRTATEPSHPTLGPGATRGPPRWRYRPTLALPHGTSLNTAATVPASSATPTTDHRRASDLSIAITDEASPFARRSTRSSEDSNAPCCSIGLAWGASCHPVLGDVGGIPAESPSRRGYLLSVPVARCWPCRAAARTTCRLARAGAVTLLRARRVHDEEPWRERCRADHRSGPVRAGRAGPDRLA